MIIHDEQDLKDPVYERVLKEIYLNEGIKDGKSGEYFDDGTHTNAGIAWEYHKETLKSYGIFGPEDMHKALEIAPRFYYYEFWLKSKANLLPLQLAYQHMDFAVNKGNVDAIRTLQTLLNRWHPQRKILVMDGLFGPKTMSSLEDLDRYYVSLHNIQIRLAEHYMDLRYAAYFEELFHRARARPDEREAILDRFESSWIRRLRLI